MKKVVDTNAELQELRKIACNKKCFDCNQAGTTYAIPELGIFLCSICGGIHREFNHRVKGLSTCNFTESEVNKLKALGNEQAHLIWMAKHDPRVFPIPDIKDSNRLKEFLRLKYLEKRFYEIKKNESEKSVEIKPEEKKLEKSLTSGFINLIDDDQSSFDNRRQSEVRPSEPNMFQASFPNGTFQGRKNGPDPNLPYGGSYQPSPGSVEVNHGLYTGQTSSAVNNPNVGNVYNGQPNPAVGNPNVGNVYTGQPIPAVGNPNAGNVYTGHPTPGISNPNIANVYGQPAPLSNQNVGNNYGQPAPLSNPNAGNNYGQPAPLSNPNAGNNYGQPAPTGNPNAVHNYGQPAPTGNPNVGNNYGQPAPISNPNVGNNYGQPAPISNPNVGNNYGQPAPTGKPNVGNNYGQPAPTGNPNVGNNYGQPAPSGNPNVGNNYGQPAPTGNPNIGNNYGQPAHVGNPNIGNVYTGQPAPGFNNPNIGMAYTGQPAPNNPNYGNTYAGQPAPINVNPSIGNIYPGQPNPQNFRPAPNPVNPINFNQYTNQPAPHYPIYNNSSITPPGIQNPGFSATAAHYPMYSSNIPQYGAPSSISPNIVGGGQQVFFKSSDPFEQLVEEEKQRKLMQNVSRNQMSPQQNLLFQQFSVQAQMYENNYGKPYPYNFQQWLSMNSAQETRPNTKNPFDRF